MKGLIGKKIGMTHIYDDQGLMIPVTVVQVGPCRVTGVRTKDRDGYSALQIGFGARKPKNVSKAVRTHVAAAGYSEHVPERIRELRLAEDPEQSVGDVLGADIFEADEFVDVTGVTKGRGFQGVVRRYKFGGGRASHGGGWTRRGGSIGMCVNPGKIYKGRKMPGQMGNVQRTSQNLRIVQVRQEENLLLIKGAVPGANGRFVMVRKAKKK
jgi:large subunit ribosomal protein L3